MKKIIKIFSLFTYFTIDNNNIEVTPLSVTTNTLAISPWCTLAEIFRVVVKTC